MSASKILHMHHDLTYDGLEDMMGLGDRVKAEIGELRG